MNKQLVKSHQIIGYELARTPTGDGREFVILQTGPASEEVTFAHMLAPVGEVEVQFEARVLLAEAIERIRFLGIDIETLERLFQKEMMTLRPEGLGVGGMLPQSQQTTEITPELKRMNRYWFMLSATLNELDMALNAGDYTPEERLNLVRALYEQMQRHMPLAAPPSVTAEALAGEVENMGDDGATQPEEYYRRTTNGIEGPFTYTAEDGAPFTPEEDAIMQADWERDHARRNNVA